jgi:hypothetical protein
MAETRMPSRQKLRLLLVALRALAAVAEDSKQPNRLCPVAFTARA